MKLNKSIKILCLLLFALLSANTYAQSKKNKKELVADTAKKVLKPKINPLKKIKPYENIINKNFTTKKGLFGVHENKDSVYFEIPDTLLNKDILVINRLKKTPANYNIFPGEQLSSILIQFELGPDSAIRIRYNMAISEANEGDAINKAIKNSSLKPLIATFPIAAYAKDSSSYVIDVSKFLKEVNFINTFPAEFAKNFSTSTIANVRVESIRTHPINVEITISKSVNQTAQTVAPDKKPVTFETGTSFILLPKKPMQRRYFDKRVGYFARGYYAFADDQHRAETRQFISRWRLEPKDADIEKWKKGELVEPKKPIVIYIDPATPKQWIPFLIAGINDWQKSFQKAGFKNAIYGKEWPEQDTTMHMDDARISMLQYFPSETANAYGPHVADPRSGEIIQTRIGWYHNIMDVLNRWYIVQAGATDPAAQKAKFDDKLMGELIRFVSSHEVGHTLGLRHNFGSSSKTPVESLRDINYLKKNGHTASIMDYARFNYVAQPEDNIPQQYLFPKIGDYDDWAIEWGYKSSFAANADEDKKVVSKWIVDRVNANPRLWFGDGETRAGDPRVQTEDLGDNSMKASTYGIKNLKRIMPNIKNWTYEEGGQFTNTSKVYNEVVNQYYRYLMHVLNNIGGIYRTYNSEGETAPIFTATPKKLQLEAIAFLDKELFTTPTWLLNNGITDKIYDPIYNRKDNPAGSNFVEDLQIKSLNTLLDTDILHLIQANNKRFGANTYGINDHLTAVRNSIWKGLKNPKVTTDSYHRNLQKSYVGSIINIIIAKIPDVTETDITSLAKAELKIIRQTMKVALAKSSDNLTKYHFTDLIDRIDKIFDSKS